MQRRRIILIAAAWLVGALAPPTAADCDPAGYRVGAGIYDITGPVVELRMMGYAMLHQMTRGLRNRLRARAFVIESGCEDRRVAMVTADLGLLTQAVHRAVLERLAQFFGDRYTAANVLLAATHTHSGPGGYSHYTLYNLTILGFSEASFRVAVDGIVRSIALADANLTPADVYLARGDVEDATLNRSRIAYEENPIEERALYAHDTDKTMTQLYFEDHSGRPLGLLNWFGVHATSVGNRNHLINGDNKGYASQQVERHFGTDYSKATTFVAAFAQGSEGDVSPNIFGGTDGGGSDDFESAAISGGKQAIGALHLLADRSQPLSGPVDVRQAYVKMDSVEVAPTWTGGAASPTCSAAIGYSMLAGAEDGPGIGREGLTCAEPRAWWQRAACWATTSECQAEKPIALDMGRRRPVPWTPEVLPLQIIRLGPLAVVAIPFEITTMAARRLRATVERELAPAGVEHIVVAGLANAYSGYVATREEYRVQHYEGASTHFGPWTLAALQQEFARLAAAMHDGRTVDPGPQPRDLAERQLAVPGGPTHDATPIGVSFGDVYRDAQASYRTGETVRVTFAGAHLGHDSRIQDTFLVVERQVGDGWQRVADDDAWETSLEWERDFCLPALACSSVTVVWQVPADAVAGRYRIRHMGSRRTPWTRRTMPYTGTSSAFEVVNINAGS